MADWPLTSDLGPLGALPTAPRLARGFISVVLTAWGLTALADVTELLVSELTANVVRASTGPDGNPRYDNEGKLPLLWVRLLSDHFRIMIEVWDNLPPALGTPVVRHPGPDEESGRGLEMIDALSEDWGWESVPGWKGKRVWAVLLAPLANAVYYAAERDIAFKYPAGVSLIPLQGLSIPHEGFPGARPQGGERSSTCLFMSITNEHPFSIGKYCAVADSPSIVFLNVYRRRRPVAASRQARRAR